jgi:hypothetical protein
MWLDHGGQKRGLDDVAKNVKVERGNVAWTSRPQQNPIQSFCQEICQEHSFTVGLLWLR